MFERLDLGNLLALHVLLEERNVTRAAQRLGLTQSSMSHRLARLRADLGDALLVRAGGQLIPTPRAEAITQPLSEALRMLEEAVKRPAVFDPNATRFLLSLALPDLLAPLARRIVEQVRQAAPHAKIRLAQVPATLSEWLASTPCSIALAPIGFGLPTLVARPLGDLSFAVVGRKDHPALRSRLTVGRWLAYPHVVVRIGNDRSNVLEDALDRQGLERVVGLESPSFLIGLHALGSSDLLMNAPIPIVNELASELQLAVRPLPVAVPKVRFAMLFHERYQHDAAHRFARERVFSATASLFRGKRSGGRTEHTPTLERR
jgi:DNA-binding transcriptional LysR family regulator